MGQSRRRQPRVEPLEGRELLSAASAPSRVDRVVQVAVARKLALTGKVNGMFRILPAIPGLGEGDLAGSGQVRPLGRVNLSGVVGFADLIAAQADPSDAHLDLTLSNARGALTVRIAQGATPVNPSAQPYKLRYTLVGGSGAFRNATGSGAVDVAIPNVPTEVGAQGTFTLTFRRDRLAKK